ncbi:acetyltransferase (GNAT) family protein [Vibrio nigripulchritudo ATCC 27043]|uniref:GNAT family N-acetyltransferase n=1 Tax=Vibrio nigripulchritudo TaxID=28173 RepID=UPI00021C0D73|nr:GNAT family N-acetyltransferase [Vibrio nigripulchritudo]EGU61156.1 acetyltransferase (GNAT) family protein [Vibrio nigripulchritudo ATCC 27043]
MIKSARLELRKFIPNDKEPMLSLLQDKDFMAFSPTGVMTKQQAELRFQGLLDAFSKKGIGKFAVIESVSAELIGYCGIESFQYKGEEVVELGYRIKKSARGKGYAQEASQAALRFAKQSGYTKVLALAELDNAPSHHILYKLGFEASEKGHYQNMPVQYFEKNL